MFPNSSIYGGQYGAVPGQMPPTQPPTQPPSNSYTIDIASASYNLVPDSRGVPPPQPNFNAFSAAAPPQVSPLPFASPSANSPNNYVYQAAPSVGGPPVGGPPVGGAPPPAFGGIPPPAAGLGMNYSPPQTMDTTPRFNVPLPNINPAGEMPKPMGYVPGMSPPPQSVSPFSPPGGFNMGYQNPGAAAPINPLPTAPPPVQPNAFFGSPPPAW